MITLIGRSRFSAMKGKSTESGENMDKTLVEETARASRFP
jgi:hypothetical protein